MAKFQTHQVVWVKKDAHAPFWPAKIKRVFNDKDPQYEVYLFTAQEASGLQLATLICSENNVLPFREYHYDQRQTPANLYQAYKVAKRHLAKDRQVSNDSLHQKHQQNKDWTKQDLYSFFEAMKKQTLSEEQIRLGRIRSINYQFKNDISQINYFFEQNLCQTIGFLLGEKKMDNQTKVYLSQTKNSLKAAIIEAAMCGDIYIRNDS